MTTPTFKEVYFLKMKLHLLWVWEVNSQKCR